MTNTRSDPGFDLEKEFFRRSSIDCIRLSQPLKRRMRLDNDPTVIYGMEDLTVI